MIFLAGIALAVAVGYLAGGRLERVAGLPIAWPWVVPVAFFGQIAAIYGPWPVSDNAVAIPLIVGTHVALLAMGLRNIRVVGMPVAAVGVAMNLAVMLANGGLMPVAPETLQRAGRTEAWKIGDGSPGTRLTQSKDVIRLPEETWFEPLADRFTTGLPGRLSIIFSLGDLVLLAGVAVLIVRTMTTTSASSLQLTERGLP